MYVVVKKSALAYLKMYCCKNREFYNMARMCHGPKRQFQHGWSLECVGVKHVSLAWLDVSWSKTSVSAWLKCVVVKNASFSMAKNA
jgi:hypothetical protein